MNTNELKEAITEDLKQLKHLEIEVIPAKIYYTGLFKLAANAFWKIGLVLFLAQMFVSLTYTDPRAAMNEVYWGSVHSKVSFGKQVIEALFTATGMMLIVVLILTPAFNSYFLIHYHLKEQLKTGDFLVRKLRGCGWLFFSLFILSSALFASSAEPNLMFFYEIISLILSAVVTYFVMGMEFNRMGLSVLFTVITRWLSKDKK